MEEFDFVEYSRQAYDASDDLEKATPEPVTPSDSSEEEEPFDFVAYSRAAQASVVPDEDEEEEPFDFVAYSRAAQASVVSDDDEEDEYGFDTGRKYKKDDLKTGKAARDIRDYMVRRAGKKYREGGDIDNDRLVEDFVDHWRFFDSNVIGTAGEARFIATASEEDKLATKRAIELYDGLGNVFVNDGFYGAVDGAWDYVQAAASDPSNYIGLLTGGMAKAGALGGSQATKALVRKAAREAGLKAMKATGSREAAEAASKEAVESALARHSLEFVKTKAAREAVDKLAIIEKNNFKRRQADKAAKKVYDKAARKADTKALGITTATDALVAMAQDYTIQGLRMEVGAQEEYSALQTGASSVLGGLAGGAQLLGRAFKGSSGLAEADAMLRGSAKATEAKEAAEKAITREVGLSKPLLGEQGSKEAGDSVLEGVRTWKEKWQAGRRVYSNETTEADLLKRIVLGSDGKGKKDGIVKLFRDQGLKLPGNATISDALTNVIQHMPQKQLEEINEMLKPTHMTLGDMAGSRAKLQDLVANESNRAGQVLNVFSQAKRMLDSNIVVADDILREATEGVIERESKEADKMQGLAYGQNIWRRMLVSSPATTAANVAGFSNYAVGSTLADLLAGTALSLKALGQTGAKRQETLRVGRVYRNMVGTKMRYLADPFTTHDAYMKFLEENSTAGKVLFETVTGGVEKSATRFGMDPDSKWFKGAEWMADTANKATGVSIQDTFTKSQMFMSELDKYLQINKKITLRDAINGGDTSMIDNDVIGAALDGTMKSVFSKDYTKGDNVALSSVAKMVETTSNIPGLGTVFPFGRFMNNVVATAYEWGPGGIIEGAKAIAFKDKRNLTTLEAVSRSTVALSAIGMAAWYDKEKLDKGMASTDIEVAGGQVADIKNVYPLSLLLVSGRIARFWWDEQPIPKELKQEWLNQMAIGQVARDVQFGNDLFAIMDFMDPSSGNEAGASWDAAWKTGGNILAGFTRPLDAINRSVGLITDSDVAKDVRQARGSDVLTQSATKYVDNIFELFTQDVEAITGEELRVATREGALQDPNPAARIAGLVIKPPQNATELAYGMSEMMTFTANARSKNPAYDKAFNTFLAPMLDRVAEDLLKDDKFTKGSVDQRRRRLKTELTKLKSVVREYMKTSRRDGVAIEAMRKDAMTKGSPGARRSALKLLKSKGVEAPLRDLGYTELQLYMDHVKIWDEYYGARK